MTGPVGLERFVGPRAAGGSSAGGVFISDWNTANTSTGSSASTQVTLPLESTGVYDFTVHWGDGSSDTISAWDAAEKTHTYAISGTYRIQITGTCQGWRFNNTGDRLKLVDVLSWGPIQLGSSAGGFFYGCANFSVSAVDAPGLDGVTDLTNCFRECTNLAASNLAAWDVSAVTDMTNCFYAATTFNGDISGWNTGLVTSFNQCFLNCTAFNQPLGAWDVSSATNFAYMFIGCAAFNQDLSAWVTSAASQMQFMFHGASAFNSELRTWNVGNVANMQSMFNSTPFNKPLSLPYPITVSTNLAGSSYADVNTFILEDALEGDFQIDFTYLSTTTTNLVFGVQTATAPNGGVNNYVQLNYGVQWNGATTLKMWESGTSLDITATVAVGDVVSFRRSGSTVSFYINNVLAHTFTGTSSAAMYGAAAFGISDPVPLTIRYNNWKPIDFQYRGTSLTTATVTDGSEAADYAAGWDTSAVSNMSQMFMNTSEFNGEVGRFDLSSCTNLSSMFNNAAAFKRRITNWNVSGVTNFSAMFQDAILFNSFLTGWVTSSATDMSNMFNNADAFAAAVDGLDYADVTSLTGFMSNKTYGSSPYSNLLAALDLAPTLQAGLTLDMGTSQYLASAAAARASIISKWGWTINDGGQL